MNILNTITNRIRSKGSLFLQILFTLLAFSAMASLSYFFIHNIVHNSLVRSAGSIMAFARNQLESSLRDSRATMNGFSQTVRRMILHGDDADAIQLYIDEISEHIRSNGNCTFDTSGFFGYFETFPGGPVFKNGSHWEAPENYDPTQRPWYKMAVAAGGEIIETPPYTSLITGEYVISFARCIYDDNGRRLGVICLNLMVDHVGRDVIEFFRDQGGYGTLISSDLEVIAHTNPIFIGKDARDPALPLSAFADHLVSGNDFLDLPLTNWKGEKTIAFFRKISNGWYLGFMTPKAPFYQGMTNMEVILGTLGAILAAALTGILISIDKARNKSDRESRHKSAFLANMSHEIRTPMNAIIGMTNIGKSSAEAGKKDYCLSKIEDASAHLLGVINDILDMSKIEANKFELSPAEFNFEKMIHRVVSVNNFRLEGRKQKLTVHIDKTIPGTLIGDDHRLVQVISNLLGNAIKFTPEFGLIGLEAYFNGEEDGLCAIQVSVKDTGIGINPKEQERIFSSFEQAESSTTRKYGGTGLGLSISKSIINLMGGNIWVQSEPGKGSTFSFSVPMKRGLNDTHGPLSHGVNSGSAETADETLLDLNGMFAGKRILLAEDVDINREIVQALLEPTQIGIDIAENGVEAVRKFRETPGKYDLIFMDLQMPEMDGYDATRRIRAFEAQIGRKPSDPGFSITENRKFPERYARVPIVAMTANVFREDIEKCIEAGMNSHVGKPLDFDEVIGVMRSYLLREKSA